MEYVDGLNFDEYLAKKGPLPEHQALHYFIQLVSTLQYCHGNQALHRDIKPQNILITKNHQLKLAVFGISKIIEDSNSLAVAPIGPPYCIASEIFNKKPSRFPANVLSLGCVLYEMVSCKKSFGGDHLLFLQSIMNDNPFSIQASFSQRAEEKCFRENYS
jgi:serine/threonine protein kinase